MKLGKYFFFVISIVIFFMNGARACTTFCFQNNNERIYGRNYDCFTEHYLIIVNKRGVAKTALTEDNPAQWASQHSSITFNQYSRELPLGGMNEAGQGS